MKALGVGAAVAIAAVTSVVGSAAAWAYPNQYEGLQIGGCATWDRVHNLAGPADCDSVAAEYRLIEQHSLTAETQDQRCGSNAKYQYYWRTDEGFRLAIYCFTYNMPVDSCWDLTDVNNAHRVDCAAGIPGTERVTAVIEGVFDENPCTTAAVIYPKLGFVVCVVPN